MNLGGEGITQFRRLGNIVYVILFDKYGEDFVVTVLSIICVNAAAGYNMINTTFGLVNILVHVEE